MGWRDRLARVMAAETAEPDTAKCAHVKTANNAKTPPLEVLAHLTVLTEGYFPENVSAGAVAKSSALTAADLLRHMRDVLHCRVTLDGDRPMIGPTHRCPPAVVAAAMAVVDDLRALLLAEGGAP